MIDDTSASLARVGIELGEGRQEGRSQTKSPELEAAPLYLEEVSGALALFLSAFFSKKRIPLLFCPRAGNRNAAGEQTCPRWKVRRGVGNKRRIRYRTKSA